MGLSMGPDGVLDALPGDVSIDTTDESASANDYADLLMGLGSDDLNDFEGLDDFGDGQAGDLDDHGMSALKPFH